MSRVYGFLQDIDDTANMALVRDGVPIGVENVRGSDELILFAHGTDVSVFSTVLPSRSEAESRRAAPYAVEDEIATPIEETHFALGEPPQELQTPRAVHVVAIEQMKIWTDVLAQTPSLAHAQIVAEQSVVPIDTALQTDDRFVVNIEGRAATVDSAMPDVVLKMLLDGRSSRLLSKTDLLTELAGFADAQSELIDLRQGAFSQRRKANLGGLSAWRLTGGLAATFLAVWVGASWLEVRALNAESEKIQNRIEQAYAAAFPDAPKPRNYVGALAQEVNKNETAPGLTFLSASTQLYTALETFPSVELKSIRFDQDQGTLIARLAYAAYGEDVALKDALESDDIAVTLGSARQEDGRVVGDLTLRGGGR